MKTFKNPLVTFNFYELPYYAEKFGYNEVKGELLMVNCNKGTCRARIESFDGEPLGTIDISMSYIKENTITVTR